MTVWQLHNEFQWHFDETGMTEGVWQKTSKGTRFWYGEWYYEAANSNQRYFVEIEGKREQ